MKTSLWGVQLPLGTGHLCGAQASACTQPWGPSAVLPWSPLWETGSLLAEDRSLHRAERCEQSREGTVPDSSQKRWK